MALSPEEMNRLRTLIESKRTGNFADFGQKSKKETTQDRLADVGDETATRMNEAISGTGRYEDASLLRRGVGATASAFSSVPSGALAIAPELVRDGVKKVGGVIGEGFNFLTDKISNTKLFSDIGKLEAQGYINPQDNPEFYALKDALATTAETSEIAGTILGAEGGIRTGNLTRTGLAKTGEVAKTGIQTVSGLTKEALQNIPSVKSLRLKLSDIDPQVETILKRSNADEVNRYFQQAQNAKANPSKATPLELAGTKAEDAFNMIDKARKDAVTAKKQMLTDKSTQTLGQNPAGNLIDKIKTESIEKFGIKINPDGTIATASGRVSKLDKPSQKLLMDYVTKLRQLGISPTAQKVDDFVDWAQSQLYKQSKEVSTLKSADDATVGYLKGITGELNDNLKTQIGGGYGEVNARISRLIELQDELGKALGADARKGGGLMKKLFSPTGGDTRRIFEAIQKETGIDLFKEATLAKFAMESVGDVRQKSLLKQLDVALQETAELDLTKPMSIYRWLREKSDLDGQELANQLLKEINASSAAKK